MSYKVEFLTSALSRNGIAEWISNSYRYQSETEALQHWEYLRGPGAPPADARVIGSDDPPNIAFQNGKSSRI